MKKLSILFVALIFTALSITAQVDVSSEVPEAVAEAFTSKYADADEVVWSQEDGNWEAEFVIAEQEYEATFGIDGSWMKTAQEIDIEEVPATITAALEAKMPGVQIDEVEITETPSGKFYEIEAMVGGKEMVILTDLDGKILQKDAG